MTHSSRLAYSANFHPFLKMRNFTWDRGSSLVLALKSLILARKPGEYAIISFGGL